MTNKPTVIQKLLKSDKPSVLIADIDGTLFSASWRIITAPFYNYRTSSILKTRSVPLILVTGRPQWNSLSDFEMKMLGMTQTDLIIYAAGTKILIKNSHGYWESDSIWEKSLLKSKMKITSNQKIITKEWDSGDIYEFTKKYLRNYNLKLIIFREDFAVRIRVEKLQTDILRTIIKTLKTLFADSLKIVITEKLMHTNSLNIFSGEIILVPEISGKEGAIKYLMTYLRDNIKKQIHADIFGDASIDTEMLIMTGLKDKYSLSQYAVNPTPLANQFLQENKSKNRNLHIINRDGPGVIFSVINKKYSQQYYSATQNSGIRTLIRPFESILDKLIDKSLTPNEISYLGLNQVIKGINLLKTGNALKKIKGLRFYVSGTLIDLFDGIRVRKSGKSAPDGQLVDVFCDRTKELYQLFVRSKDRFSTNEEQGYKTLLTAISCLLPSLARSQGELKGIIVPEHDGKKGSMLHRSYKLFFSLILNELGFKEKSLILDLNIYNSNMETFRNRVQISNTKSSEKETESTKQIQQKSFERYLLLVDLLQQEYTEILHILKNHPLYAEKFKETFGKQTYEFLQIDVKSLRAKQHFKNYNFSIKKYLI